MNGRARTVTIERLVVDGDGAGAARRGEQLRALIEAELRETLGGRARVGLAAPERVYSSLEGGAGDDRAVARGVAAAVARSLTPRRGPAAVPATARPAPPRGAGSAPPAAARPGAPRAAPAAGGRGA